MSAPRFDTLSLPLLQDFWEQRALYVLEHMERVCGWPVTEEAATVAARATRDRVAQVYAGAALERGALPMAVSLAEVLLRLLEPSLVAFPVESREFAHARDALNQNARPTEPQLLLQRVWGLWALENGPGLSPAQIAAIACVSVPSVLSRAKRAGILPVYAGGASGRAQLFAPPAAKRLIDWEGGER